MNEQLKKAARLLLKLEQFIAVVCCIAIILLVFITVFMRYIFKTGFQGMEELIMLFAFGIYFIGGALGTYYESQITADLTSLLVKNPRKMMGIKAFQNLIDGLLIGVCAVFSTQQMLFVLQIGSRSSGLKLPVWVMYTIILVGLFLMSFYALWHFWDYAKRTINYSKRSGAEKEGESV